MSGVRRWRDTDNLGRAVETAGGREAFDHIGALGGTLKLIADFGDMQLKVA